MMRSKFRARTAVWMATSLSMGITSVALAQDNEKKESHWYDGIRVGAFVDAYGALRSDNNAQHDATGTATAPDGTVTRLDPHSVPSGVANPGVVGPYGHDAYVQASGFALAFAGLDVSYSGEQLGATLSLRFGPGVNRFFGGDQGPFGIDNVTQAYATWKPTQSLTLDLGQFYTLYGAEVAESWRNMNYSRGGLYYAMQPFWHTGLRANYQFNEKLALNAMVVNGVNTAFEGNKSPTLGIQALINPTNELFFAVGYMTGLTPRDGDDETMVTKNFQDFVDVVATYTHGGFKVAANADFNSYRAQGAGKRENWWGVSLAPGYSFTSWFGIAGRVEYMSDSANSQLFMAVRTNRATGVSDFTQKQVHLTTLTGTLDFKPVSSVVSLILRPEFRYEIASDTNFYKWGETAPTSKHFWSAHLGAVVTTLQ